MGAFSFPEPQNCGWSIHHRPKLVGTGYLPGQQLAPEVMCPKPGQSAGVLGFCWRCSDLWPPHPGMCGNTRCLCPEPLDLSHDHTRRRKLRATQKGELRRKKLAIIFRPLTPATPVSEFLSNEGPGSPPFSSGDTFWGYGPRSKKALKSEIHGAPGRLSRLNIRLWLRSQSRSSGVRAPCRHCADSSEPGACF